MAENAAFNWKTLSATAVRTRTDIGTFPFGTGVAARADAIWNFAPFAKFHRRAPFVGGLLLGLKKLVVDRDPPPSPPPAKAPKTRAK